MGDENHREKKMQMKKTMGMEWLLGAATIYRERAQRDGGCKEGREVIQARRRRKNKNLLRSRRRSRRRRHRVRKASFSLLPRKKTGLRKKRKLRRCNALIFSVKLPENGKK